MIIKQTRVRSAHKYLSALLPDQEFRICTAINSEMKERLTLVGFTSPLKNGDTILPEAVGSVSAFNSEGSYELLKDEPKERRYVTTIECTWEQWIGGGDTKTVTEPRDIFKDCYQRKMIDPPAIEVTWLETEKEALVTTSAP